MCISNICNMSDVFLGTFIDWFMLLKACALDEGANLKTLRYSEGRALMKGPYFYWLLQIAC